MIDQEPIFVARDVNMHLFLKSGVARVVDNVSLVVRKGEVLGIVGESGSGKSMIALSLLGLPPQPYGKIVGGSISYRGVDLLNPRSARTVVGKRIGMVFENPGASLDPCYRIGDQITEAIRTHQAIERPAARARAIELLKLVGIADPGATFSSYPHQLSGGMQQRVGIAIALCCNPEMLDRRQSDQRPRCYNQAQIMRLIEDLRARLGLTVVWITQQHGDYRQGVRSRGGGLRRPESSSSAGERRAQEAPPSLIRGSASGLAANSRSTASGTGRRQSAEFHRPRNGMPLCRALPTGRCSLSRGRHRASRYRRPT